MAQIWTKTFKEHPMPYQGNNLGGYLLPFKYFRRVVCYYIHVTYHRDGYIYTDIAGKRPQPCIHILLKHQEKSYQFKDFLFVDH